jgi:IQ calmodulin-binding motif
MGNCCGTNDKDFFNKQNVNTLVKIQSAYRTHLARKELKEIREKKLKTLFGKQSK